MRRFYFYRRNGVYYAKLNTPSGVSLSGRSTKTRNRNEALLIVAEWLKNGVPTGRERKPKPVALAVDLPGILKAIRQADLDTEDAMTIVSILRERELVDFGVTKTGPGREKFISFLSRFWDLDRSPYLKDKIAHGHRITQKYCREAAQKIARHWEPYFRDTVALNGITRATGILHSPPRQGANLIDHQQHHDRGNQRFEMGLYRADDSDRTPPKD